MSKLSLKHQQFVNEYLKCWNATRAYMAVYPKTSENTARTTASKLLAKANISEAIQRRIDENAMSANEIVQRLGRHARGSLSEFIKVDDEDWSVDLQKAQKSENLDLLKKITRTEKTFKIKDKEETTVITTIELHDVQNALTLLGKNHGLFSDQIKITNELERALDLLEKKLDDDTYDTVLSALSDGGFSGAKAAKTP